MQLLTPFPLLQALGMECFVAIDLETTGLDANADEILEVGMAKVVKGKVCEHFNQLIQVEQQIPEHISSITGINNEDVVGQPSINEVLPRIIDFIGDAPLVGHNIGFDLSFLNEQLQRVDLRQQTNFVSSQPASSLKMRQLPNPHIDTLVLSRILLPRLSNHRLEHLAQYFGLSQKKTHRALDDALTVVNLFDYLIQCANKLDKEVLGFINRLLKPWQGRDSQSNLLPDFFGHLADLSRSGERIPTKQMVSQQLSSPPKVDNLIGFETGSQTVASAKFDFDKIKAVFLPGGILEKARPGYEARPQQLQMVEAVCRAFSEESFLLIEAGTGTGKSWAYLIPAIYWSQSQIQTKETDDSFLPTRIIISTNTKNLQEQIFFKDIPFLRSHLKLPFRAVLLKGRNNYLCWHRWKDFILELEHRQLSSLKERLELLPVAVWLSETLTGDIEENTGFRAHQKPYVWAKLHSDSRYCKGNKCSFNSVCFVNRVRRAARNAHLVVVNHSLLFSDLVSNNSVLSEYQNLIVDEAHNLENAATQYLGVEAHLWQIRNLVNNLYYFDGRETGLLPRMRQAIYKGKLSQNTQETLLGNIEAVTSLTRSLDQASSRFFRQLSEACWEFNLRQRQPIGTKIRYRDWLENFPSTGIVTNEFLNELQELAGELRRLHENLLLVKAEEIAEVEDFLFDLEGTCQEADELLAVFKMLIEATDQRYVFWLEPSPRGENFDSRIKAAPLNVSFLLKPLLYERLRTAIFTSATLSINGQFDYFKSRVGLDLVDPDRLLENALGSPFDFEHQVLVAVPKFLPTPKEVGFIETTVSLLCDTISHLHRGTLILFTSYELLGKVYEGLKINLESEDVLILGQGKDGARHALLRQFCEQKGTVLLGTNSFWEGIDIPGTPLEILVITRLPFEVPSEPIIQARMEAIEQRGGNSFYQFSVPAAILRFRQGFGRLIRTKSDRGVVIILDNRALRFRYGSLFLESLPVIPKVFNTPREMLNAIEKWFFR